MSFDSCSSFPVAVHVVHRARHVPPVPRRPQRHCGCETHLDRLQDIRTGLRYTEIWYWPLQEKHPPHRPRLYVRTDSPVPRPLFPRPDHSRRSRRQTQTVRDRAARQADAGCRANAYGDRLRWAEHITAATLWFKLDYYVTTSPSTKTTTSRYQCQSHKNQCGPSKDDSLIRSRQFSNKHNCHSKSLCLETNPTDPATKNYCGSSCRRRNLWWLHQTWQKYVCSSHICRDVWIPIIKL